ncbi:TetR/AcrR family transcriptional regulator [Streptomyces sp. NPDC056568]|uniref:TetR/AcrR family transcriptional regulator n=1 Tax=Streptomyces sp. NPDC056568 TaxID=3345866 RepID=UPI00367D65C7
MPRMSREVAEQHRQQVIRNTSRLIREKGADGVTVPEAMDSAGLTHGGFYRHFTSKDDLLAQALTAAFVERRTAMDRIGEDHDCPDGPSARASFLAMYLSELHRDHPADGCPAAAVAADAARTEPGAPLRTAFTAGLRDLADGLRQWDEPEREGGSEAALADLALLVGTVLLARASDDRELSHAFLEAARDRLDPQSTQPPASSTTSTTSTPGS